MFVQIPSPISSHPCSASPTYAFSLDVFIHQNDASPYVEAIINRSRAIREAVYRVPELPDAQAPSAREASSLAVPAEPPSGPTENAIPIAGTPAGTGNVSGPAGLSSPTGQGSREVPARSRGPVWTGVLEATLLALLRGFSRVKRCSTEGRALMSMDLQVRSQVVRTVEPRWFFRGEPVRVSVVRNGGGSFFLLSAGGKFDSL